MRTGGFSPGAKRSGRESDHSHVVPRAIMSRTIPPLSLYVSVVCIEETNVVLIGDYEEPVCFIKRFMAMISLLRRIYSRMFNLHHVQGGGSLSHHKMLS
jgi:hypothetical protein